MSVRPAAIVTLAFSLVFSLIPASSARAQQPLKFVRLSAAATGARATERGVLREQRIELGAVAGLFQADSGRMIQLDLFPDLSIVAVRERVEISPAARVWVGTIPNYDGGRVILSSSGDEVVGSIWTFAAAYRIRHALSGYVVEQLQPPERENIDDAVVPPPQSGANVVAPFTAADVPKDDGSVIDVMVVYTNASRAEWGSDAAANAAIGVDIASVNSVLQTSRLASRVRLVYSGAVAYVEAGDTLTDLTRLQSSRDGFLDDVHALRNAYAADLVQMIVTDTETCGRGYVRTSPQQDSSWGFTVVSRTCVANHRTTAHELGHNFGVQHDWYVTDTRGYFTDSHGYVSLSKGFYDVMAYPNLCSDTRTTCTQLFVYSTPNLFYKNTPIGIPAGTDLSCRAGQSWHTDCDADAVRTILTTLPDVARYRDSATNTHFPQVVPQQTIYSSSRAFGLTYQSDGNVVVQNRATGEPIWHTRTAGTAPGVMLLTYDGNLVVFDEDGKTVWASGTAGHRDANAVLQDDGNLVIIGSDGRPIWDAFSHPPGR